MDNSGRGVAGAIYRSGVAAEGKTPMDAAISLLNFSSEKFSVNSHVSVYLSGSETESSGFDVLAGDHLAQIAGAMGVNVSVVANGSGLGVDGATMKNSDLLSPVLSGTQFSVMQTGAKLGLHMASNENNGAGEDVFLLKKQISLSVP